MYQIIYNSLKKSIILISYRSQNCVQQILYKWFYRVNTSVHILRVNLATRQIAAVVNLLKIKLMQSKLFSTLLYLYV